MSTDAKTDAPLPAPLEDNTGDNTPNEQILDQAEYEREHAKLVEKLVTGFNQKAAEGGFIIEQEGDEGEPLFFIKGAELREDQLRSDREIEDADEGLLQLEAFKTAMAMLFYELDEQPQQATPEQASLTDGQEPKQELVSSSTEVAISEDELDEIIGNSTCMYGHTGLTDSTTGDYLEIETAKLVNTEHGLEIVQMELGFVPAGFKHRTKELHITQKKGSRANVFEMESGPMLSPGAHDASLDTLGFYEAWLGPGHQALPEAS